MSIFDSVISEVKHNIGLDDKKAGSLLSALLNYITDTKNGGILGVLERFRSAGLGSVVDSWIGNGSNEELSDEQVVTVLGDETINSMAQSSDLNVSTTTRALGSMIPGVVSALTPAGEVPDDESILSQIKGFLADWGGAIGGAVVGGAATTTAVVGNAADKVSNVVGNVVGDGVTTATHAADSAKNTVTGGFKSVADSFDSDSGSDGGNSWLRWLFLLLILGLLIALGYMFCGRGNGHVSNTNSNVNRPVANANANRASSVIDSSFKLVANDGKYSVSGVVPDQKTFDDIKAKLSAEFGADNVDFSGLKIDANAKPFAAGWWDNFGKLLPSLKGWKDGSLAFAGNAVTEANGLPSAAIDQIRALFTGWTLPDVFGTATTSARSLTEVLLPSGAKLQAYPGGIEDQVVKFITSDEFKGATEDTLKAKWFDFDDLNFKFGTTELDDNSKRQLDNIVTILKEFPTVKIKIGGYTDKKGDDTVNKKLSDDRAKAVQTSLKNAGVGEQVPEAEGYGEEFAKIPETASDEERKVDRRTSIRLIK